LSSNIIFGILFYAPTCKKNLFYFFFFFWFQKIEIGSFVNPFLEKSQFFFQKTSAYFFFVKLRLKEVHEKGLNTESKSTINRKSSHSRALRRKHAHEVNTACSKGVATITG
jgi:hypothetical protein